MGVRKYSSQLQFRGQAKTLGMIMAITLGLCSGVHGFSEMKGENKADHVTRYLQVLNESVPAEATTPSVSLPSANASSSTPVHLEAEQAKNTTAPVGLDTFLALLFNNVTDAEAHSEDAEEGIAQNSSAIASRADKLAQAFTEGSAAVQVGDLDVGQSDEQDVEESDSGSEDSSDDCNSDDSADSGSEDSDSVSVGDSDSDSDSVSVSCNESSKIMNRDDFSRGNLTTM